MQLKYTEKNDDQIKNKINLKNTKKIIISL